MVSTQQNVRFMLECDSIATANELVFTLAGHITPSMLGLGDFIQHVNGVHSEGRFVFARVQSSPQASYDSLMSLAYERLHRVALVGLDVEGSSWDKFGLRSLCETAVNSQQEQLQAHYKFQIATAYMSVVNTETCSDEQLFSYISTCHLGGVSPEGDIFIKDTLRRLELCDTIESVLRQIDADEAAYALVFGDIQCHARYSTLLWRTLVHLIVCSDFMH